MGNQIVDTENAEPHALSEPVFRSLCTDCGVSRTKDPKRCAKACQFIQPDYPKLETQVHGRVRDPEKDDELFFGPYQSMVKASMVRPRIGAQWTGITTAIAQEALQMRLVDAVLTVAPHPKDRWKPVPVLVTDPRELAACRGMRMGYAPLLSLLEPAREAGHRRIALIGIACQVYALRSLEKELGFEKIYVIGTPCSDNTTTENFRFFLEQLTDKPETVTYLEFRADYHVEMRFENGEKREIPFLQLPLSRLPNDFFPLTCKTCVDYTNSLSDITVGYMAGEGEQWLIVRNQNGQELLSLLGSRVKFSKLSSKGNRKGAVNGFMKNVELAAGGLPLRRMPDWLRPIVSYMQTRFGPRGLEFARARVEMKAIETILHLRQAKPARMASMVPNHIWALAKPYDLAPKPTETKAGLSKS